MTVSYDELNDKIQAYILGLLDADIQDKAYVNQWVLITNLGIIQGATPEAYMHEAFPDTAPFHSIKGLLMEGVNQIERFQYDDEEDLEDED